MNDWHPDAHACRLKISLVTMDSGTRAPWDLTIECAKYSLKIESVSSGCRIAPQEELQLLESNMITLSEDDKTYDKDIHDPYSMAVCFNRLQQLRLFIRYQSPNSISNISPADLKADCRVPARALTSNWPYYTDNTIFGEDYAQLLDISAAEDGENSWGLRVSLTHCTLMTIILLYLLFALIEPWMVRVRYRGTSWRLARGGVFPCALEFCLCESYAIDWGRGASVSESCLFH